MTGQTNEDSGKKTIAGIAKSLESPRAVLLFVVVIFVTIVGAMSVFSSERLAGMREWLLAIEANRASEVERCQTTSTAMFNTCVSALKDATPNE